MIKAQPNLERFARALNVCLFYHGFIYKNSSEIISTGGVKFFKNTKRCFTIQIHIWHARITQKYSRQMRWKALVVNVGIRRTIYRDYGQKNYVLIIQWYNLIERYPLSSRQPQYICISSTKQGRLTLYKSNRNNIFCCFFFRIHSRPSMVMLFPLILKTSFFLVSTNGLKCKIFIRKLLNIITKTRITEIVHLIHQKNNCGLGCGG